MIILTILLITLLVMTLATGFGLLMAFGDLIVCGLFIYWIVKLFRKKKD